MKKLNSLFLMLFIGIVMLQAQDKKIALVIGNNAYRYGGSLKNSVNDANLMAKTLNERGFEVIQKNNVSLESMQLAAADFASRVKNYDVALFFYAGHGVNTNDKNYLIPVDAQLSKEKTCSVETFDINIINNIFRDNSDNINIMILDANRKIPFRSWMIGNSRGLNAINNQAAGTIVAFATKQGKAAIDNSESIGLYTKKLVVQMNLPQTISEVFQNTRIAVFNKSNKIQCPQEWNLLTKNFYFTTIAEIETELQEEKFKESEDYECSTFEQDMTAYKQEMVYSKQIDSLIEKINESKERTREFTDGRDMKKYKTEIIGEQIWMAENLAYKTNNGCWTYKNDPNNNQKYGYLYSWETAKNVCPSGWHLPSKSDFKTLLNNYGGDCELAYKSLIMNGNSNFLAPLGGYCTREGVFDFEGASANYWSSQEVDHNKAWYLLIYSALTHADMNNSDKKLGLSVRCIKNN